MSEGNDESLYISAISYAKFPIGCPKWHLCMATWRCDRYSEMAGRTRFVDGPTVDYEFGGGMQTDLWRHDP